MKSALHPLCLLLACAIAPADASRLDVESYAFTTRDHGTVQAERGTFDVPMHHDANDGRTLRLAFVRFRSTSKRPGHPIVYLAGGPGGSGIAAARGGRFPMFMALREIADVIVLDQRGTGASSPVPPCSVAKPPLDDRPLTREPYVAFLQAATAHCIASWRDAGVDLTAYDTREDALDLESLRGDLGADRLNLLGISYGSTLALAALKVMPERIDRIVLASPLSMDQTLRLPARTGAFLARVDALVGADPRAQAAYPPLLDTMKSVLDRLDATPARVEFAMPDGKRTSLSLGRFPVEMATVQMLKNPDTLRMLPMLYAAMAAGEFRPLAGPLLADLARPLVLDGMAIAVRAASCTSPEREATVEAQAKTALLGNALNTDTAVARGAGLPRLDDDFCRPVESDVPALVLTGTLDGRTYPEGHAEILRGLRKGSQVVIENAGHDLFMASPGVTADIVDFFGHRQVRHDRIVLPAPDFMAGPQR
jgi:pimeloyl-ACP methyl ester carboxylesterase